MLRDLMGTKPLEMQSSRSLGESLCHLGREQAEAVASLLTIRSLEMVAHWVGSEALSAFVVSLDEQVAPWLIKIVRTGRNPIPHGWVACWCWDSKYVQHVLWAATIPQPGKVGRALCLSGTHGGIVNTRTRR